MHEILAPLIFVIHCDHQSYLYAQENGLVELVLCNLCFTPFIIVSPHFREEIKELLDANYLEHDSYFLFMHVMERIDEWYDNNSIKVVKVSYPFGHCYILPKIGC